MPPPVPEQLSRIIETLYRSESGRFWRRSCACWETWTWPKSHARGVRCRSGVLDACWHSGQATPLADFDGTLQGHRRDPSARFDGAQRDLVAHMESRVNDVPGGNEETGDEEIEDDRLRLIFTCCHPALPPEAQIALTLREVCGLTTEE